MFLRRLSTSVQSNRPEAKGTRLPAPALTSRLQSFEMLIKVGNFAGVTGLGRAFIAKAEALDSGYRGVV